MKLSYSIVLLLAAASVCSLTSCSIARRVHTGKSVTIESRVTQMPTVAELEVSPQQVKADTVWVNHLFKGTVSLKTQQEELIARILSAANADVLVEPKMAHESRRHWFRSNHELSVSGYPARYKEFRTATREDVEIINDVLHPDRNRPVLVTQTAQSGTLPASLASSVARIDRTAPISEVVKHRFVRKTGYRGFLDAGYYSVGEGGLEKGFGVTTTHGVQIFQQFYAGLGAGFYYVTASESRYKNGSSAMFVPVYLSLRSDLLKSRVSPYVEGRVGYEFIDAKGMYASIGGGLSIGHISLGAEYVYMTKEVGKISSYRVRLGFSF